MKKIKRKIDYRKIPKAERAFFRGIENAAEWDQEQILNLCDFIMKSKTRSLSSIVRSTFGKIKTVYKVEFSLKEEKIPNDRYQMLTNMFNEPNPIFARLRKSDDFVEDTISIKLEEK